MLRSSLRPLQHMDTSVLLVHPWLHDGYMGAFGIPDGLTPADFIAADDEATARSQLSSDADICEEIQLENHADEDSSNDENQAALTNITAREAVEMLEKVQSFPSPCSDVSEEHFKMVDGLKSYCSKSALNKLVQKKVADFFSIR